MSFNPPDARDHLRWITDHHREVFGDEPTLSQVIAFVAGFDAAWGYSLLRGFQEWLVVRLGSGYEIHWYGLARCVAHGVPLPVSNALDLTPEEDRRAAMEFVQVVLEFLDAADNRDERRRTYAAFERLRSRDELP